MVQRVYRQIKESLDADITIVTSESQKDAIISQLGNSVNIVTEPEQRDTFPAIALACAYLLFERELSDEENIVVMPCDPYTSSGYFESINRLVQRVANDSQDIMLMGIQPTAPSSKYGYIVPKHDNPMQIDSFTEKPSPEVASALLHHGALWNAGVFAFRLGFMRRIIHQYSKANSYTSFLNEYQTLPKISFDYEVVEKTSSLGVEYYLTIHLAMLLQVTARVLLLSMNLICHSFAMA
jgi:mannose-1-phosphate guanylyltransferase